MVVSGGGTKIAFGAGVASELLKKNKYSLFVGISAGAIISLFAASNHMDIFHKEILALKMSDVFNVSPVNKKGRPSFRAIINFIFNKTSLGKNKKFRTKLYSLISSSDYTNFLDTELKVGVTNFNTSNIEYKSSKDNNYTDMINWVYASSNIPIFTEPSIIGDFCYFDGGLVSYVGIEEAIASGAEEIDVILHSPPEAPMEESDVKWKPTGIIGISMRSFEILLTSLTRHDILIGKLLSETHGVKINFYYPQKPLSDNFYEIDSELAKSWWDYGVQIANT